MIREPTPEPVKSAHTMLDFGSQSEAVGIFDSYDALQAAVDKLLTSGFARCELSLAARQTGEQATEPAVILAKALSRCSGPAAMTT